MVRYSTVRALLSIYIHLFPPIAAENKQWTKDNEKRKKKKNITKVTYMLISEHIILYNIESVMRSDQGCLCRSSPIDLRVTDFCGNPIIQSATCFIAFMYSEISTNKQHRKFYNDRYFISITLMTLFPVLRRQFFRRRVSFLVSQQSINQSQFF